MKYGLSASKELSEYFRERSSLDDHNSKLLQKLANKAGSGGANGTFSPLWIILKTSAERLAELHSQMMTKTTELLKNIIKYADELHKKHKTVKEEESSTQDAVHQMKESTIAVQKAKDLYTTRQQEVEKLRKDNASAKDIEKAETKLKKLQEEYRLLVEKHNPIKQEFERKMTLTCKVSVHDLSQYQLCLFFLLTSSFYFVLHSFCFFSFFPSHSASKMSKKLISRK